MRVFSIASAIAVVASVASAQQLAPAGTNAAQGGKLQAEVHFTTDGSTWFTTNMPAYVALFDVSRTGVSQLYPTFSAQAFVPAGTFRDVALRYPAPLPQVGPLGGSALVPISGAPNMASPGWPHTLLLVASTSPLQVGNPTATNISLNHELYQRHHFTDVETAAGIGAIVQIVSPLDPGADVVTDQIDLLPQSVRAMATMGAAYDPNHVAIGYSCNDGSRTFFSVISLPGASCIAVRSMPPGLMPGPVNADLAMKRDTAAAQAAQQRALTDHNRTISDPDEIRRFMQSVRATSGGSTTGGPTRFVSSPADRNGMDVSRRSSDGGSSARMNPAFVAPPSTAAAAAAPTAPRPMAMPKPAPAPTAAAPTAIAPQPAPAAATPIKPPAD